MASHLTWFELAEFDDFLTASIIDSVFYWATIRKAYHQPNFDTDKALTAKETLKLIRNYLIFPTDANNLVASHRVNNLVQEFLKLEKVREFLKRYPYEVKIREFIKHAKRYFQLYSKDCGFDICATDRYFIKSNNLEACVIAKKVYQKNEEVKYLYGCLAQLDEDEVNSLDQNDFSIINISSRSHPCLMLGPARFVNHDCNGSAKFSSTRSGMTIIATRKILIGEEITVTYASSYFGKDNKDCLCATCEKNGTGAFAPKIPLDFGGKEIHSVEESSEDENENDEADEIIVIDSISEDENTDDESDKNSKRAYPTPESESREPEPIYEILSDSDDEDDDDEDDEDDGGNDGDVNNDENAVLDENRLDTGSSDSGSGKPAASANIYAATFMTINGNIDGQTKDSASDNINHEQNALVLGNTGKVSKDSSSQTATVSDDDSEIQILRYEEIGETTSYGALKYRETESAEREANAEESISPSATGELYRRVLRPRNKAKLVNLSGQLTTLDNFPLDDSVDSLKAYYKKNNIYSSTNKKLNLVEFSQRKILRTFQRLFSKTLFDPEFQKTHEIYDCYNCGCYFEYDQEFFNKKDYGLRKSKFAPNYQSHDYSINKLYCPRCLRHFKVFKLAWPLTRVDLSIAGDIECMRQFLTFWPEKRKPISSIIEDSNSKEVGRSSRNKPTRDDDSNEVQTFNYYDMKNYIVKTGDKDDEERMRLVRKNLGNVDFVLSNINDLKLSLRGHAAGEGTKIYSGSSSIPLRLSRLSPAAVESLKDEWVHQYNVYEEKILKKSNQRQLQEVTQHYPHQHHHAKQKQYGSSKIKESSAGATGNVTKTKVLRLKLALSLDHSQSRIKSIKEAIAPTAAKPKKVKSEKLDYDGMPEDVAAKKKKKKDQKKEKKKEKGKQGKSKVRKPSTKNKKDKQKVNGKCTADQLEPRLQQILEDSLQKRSMKALLEAHKTANKRLLNGIKADDSQKEKMNIISIRGEPPVNRKTTGVKHEDIRSTAISNNTNATPTKRLTANDTEDFESDSDIEIVQIVNHKQNGSADQNCHGHIEKETDYENETNVKFATENEEGNESDHNENDDNNITMRELGSITGDNGKLIVYYEID